MLTRKIPAWLCGAVLCCAMPAAFCQSLSGSLAVDDASQSGSGAGSMGARSAVSADASATMNAQAGGSVSAEAVSGAVAYGAVSGAGAGSARYGAGQDFRIGEASDSGAGNGRLEFGLERGLRGDHRLESKEEVSKHPVRTNAGSRTMRAEPRRSRRAWRARGDSAGNRVDSTMNSRASTTTQAGASYSADFPDSTLGTALLSPPASNRSPFDWIPGLNYGLSDFAERRFLNPSLHAGHSVQKRGREAASNKALSTGIISGGDLTSPDFSTSISDGLQMRVPDPLADLNAQ
jgi:hypothetical protein